MSPNKGSDGGHVSCKEDHSMQIAHSILWTVQIVQSADTGWDRILIIAMIKVSKYGDQRQWSDNATSSTLSRSRILLVSGSDTQNRPPRPQNHCRILRKIQTCSHYLMNIKHEGWRAGEGRCRQCHFFRCTVRDVVHWKIDHKVVHFLVRGVKKKTFFLLEQEGRKALSSRYFGGGVLRCTGWAQPLARRFSSGGTKAATASSFGQTDGTRQRGGRPAN